MKIIILSFSLFAQAVFAGSGSSQESANKTSQMLLTMGYLPSIVARIIKQDKALAARMAKAQYAPLKLLTEDHQLIPGAFVYRGLHHTHPYDYNPKLLDGYYGDEVWVGNLEIAEMWARQGQDNENPIRTDGKRNLSMILELQVPAFAVIDGTGGNGSNASAVSRKLIADERPFINRIGVFDRSKCTASRGDGSSGRPNIVWYPYEKVYDSSGRIRKFFGVNWLAENRCSNLLSDSVRNRPNQRIRK